MFNLKKRIAMGFDPMIDRCQPALLCARLIWRHHEDVAVKLRELIRVISTEIGKKERLDHAILLDSKRHGSVRALSTNFGHTSIPDNPSIKVKVTPGMGSLSILMVRTGWGYEGDRFQFHRRRTV